MTTFNKTNIKQSASITLTELLFCLAILSSALYPLVFMFQISKPHRPSSQNEYLATLLAHHSMETLIAKRAIDPSYIPEIVSEAPVVVQTNSAIRAHSFFDSALPNGANINETNDPELFWAFEPFNLSIDTYLLDNGFYKAICKINYIKDNKKMSIFFDRLLCVKRLADNDTENEAETDD